MTTLRCSRCGEQLLHPESRHFCQSLQDMSVVAAHQDLEVKEQDRLSIWDYIEDFDNADLDPEEWHENMEFAVYKYNSENGTNHRIGATVRDYVLRKKNLYKE
jgi:hypothetical protein